MKHTKLAKSLMTVGLFASAALPVAQAAPVDLWDYDVVTQFVLGSATYNGGNDGTQIQSKLENSWGADGADVFAPDSGNSLTNRSGITISYTGAGDDNRAAPDGSVSGSVATDDLINIGLGSWITHHNKIISGTFSTLLTTKIASTLTLTPDGGGPSQVLSTEFTVYFAETPNAAPCVIQDSPVECNDIFALNIDDVFNQVFVYDDVTYFVSLFPITGQGLGNFAPLSDAACAAAGADPNCVGFTTVEDLATTVRFGFVITKEPISVPEPASLALLGLGLLGFGSLRRRARLA